MKTILKNQRNRTTVIVSSLKDNGQEISETDVAKSEYSTTHLRGSCLPLDRNAIWLIRRHCPGDNKAFCSLLNFPFTDQLPVWVLTNGYFFCVESPTTKGMIT